MTARIETMRVDGGVEITKLVTSELNIVVPASVQGVPVVSLGPQFLRDSHGHGNRSLIIPNTVVRASDEALVSTSGLRSISYMGDFETFNKFKWSLCTDCVVNCADGYSFNFLNGYTMAFPEFDNELLGSHQRISEETVMARLTNPVFLTDENRERYTAYMRSRSVPMAEHAIMENDINSLRSVIDTGLLSEENLMKLLENSVRSGRTTPTSIIMSTLNRMCADKQ